MSDSPCYPTRDADADALRDKLAKAEAEIARLRAALEGAERNGSSWLNECDRRGKEIAALSMDNLTLRAALAAEREACDEWRENQHMHYKGIFGEAPCHDGACPLCVKHDARRAAEQGKTQ